MPDCSSLVLAGGRFLQCDCRVAWITEWIRDYDLQVTSRERNPQFCGQPPELRERSFYQVNPSELACNASVTEDPLLPPSEATTTSVRTTPTTTSTTVTTPETTTTQAPSTTTTAAAAATQRSEPDVRFRHFFGGRNFGFAYIPPRYPLSFLISFFAFLFVSSFCLTHG